MTPAELTEIRTAVTKLCADFPGEYWRALDRERALPDGVRAGADRGGLSRLPDPGAVRRQRPRPERRLRDPGGDPGKRRATAAAAHAQMYIMGTLLRHGNDAQKRQYLPKIATGELRLQAFGVTEPTAGTDTTSIRTTAVAAGRQLRRERPEGLDLARGALGPDAAARAHDAARRGREEDRRHCRCSWWICGPRSARA